MTLFQSSDKEGSKGKLWVLLLVLFLGLIGGAFLWKKSYQPKGHTVEIPLIQAPPGPHKVKPDGSGAPEVPHQDKTIYDKMSPGLPDLDEEKLLPTPEAPMAPVQEAQPDAPKPETPSEESIQDPIEALDQKVTKKEYVAADPVFGSTEISDVEESSPPPTFEKIPGGSGTVQVGSLPSRPLAEKEWRRMVKTHPDVLKPFKPSYIRVDLGKGQGTRYRIQIKGLESKSVAQEFCDHLNGKNSPCIVVEN